MEAFVEFFDMLLNGLKQEFVIYGHTFSFWQLYMFVICAGVLAEIIGSFFSGE